MSYKALETALSLVKDHNNPAERLYVLHISDLYKKNLKVLSFDSRTY